MKHIVCRECEESFILLPNKPGFADVCPVCTTQDPPEDEPELLKGAVTWEHKTAPIVTVTTAHYADKVNRKRGMFGPCLALGSPNFSIVERKHPWATKETSDRENEAVRGSTYTNKMGEKRKIR
jgi:hypothetical protein